MMCHHMYFISQDCTYLIFQELWLCSALWCQENRWICFLVTKHTQAVCYFSQTLWFFVVIAMWVVSREHYQPKQLVINHVLRFAVSKEQNRLQKEDRTRHSYQFVCVFILVAVVSRGSEEKLLIVRSALGGEYEWYQSGHLAVQRIPCFFSCLHVMALCGDLLRWEVDPPVCSAVLLYACLFPAPQLSGVCCRQAAHTDSAGHGSKHTMFEMNDLANANPLK